MLDGVVGNFHLGFHPLFLQMLFGIMHGYGELSNNTIGESMIMCELILSVAVLFGINTNLTAYAFGFKINV